MASTAAEPHRPSLPKSVLSHRNRVAAARVQLIIDKRLGRETPEWIRRLAEDEDS